MRLRLPIGDDGITFDKALDLQTLSVGAAAAKADALGGELVLQR